MSSVQTVHAFHTAQCTVHTVHAVHTAHCTVHCEAAPADFPCTRLQRSTSELLFPARGAPSSCSVPLLLDPGLLLQQSRSVLRCPWHLFTGVVLALALDTCGQADPVALQAAVQRCRRPPALLGIRRLGPPRPRCTATSSTSHNTATRRPGALRPSFVRR